ncbi:hypothetical protein LIER_30070 [Lithospermum erythrorhizon]|uniref:Uncharacterized protein n=1 Tax=Lithospermum erythrorhizon TaxID=34254 RepID=A0AAV3RLE5_LITER
MVSKENYSNRDSNVEEEEDDHDETLSFRDLPILADHDQENNISITRKIPLPSHEDPFEFFNNLLFQESSPTTPRVIISQQKEQDQEPIVKLSTSSSSSSSNSNRRSSNPYYNNNTYSSSSSSRPFSSISNVEKVNITSLTSMSSKSRKMMFMFGPMKFNNEMELSSIKMRQSKRAMKDNLVSQAAAAAARELAIVSTTTTTIAGGSRSSEWRLLRSLSRYRSRATVDSSARSCGCFS